MNRLLSSIILFLLPLILFAQEIEDNQADMRLNPEIENEEEVKVNYADFPFLNLEANHIQMNGADWSGLRRTVLNSLTGDGITSVVHLGDSHIQADFIGSVVRKRLAAELGDAGRGIIIPFKAAGTNEPFDYSYTFEGNISTSKLLKQPWATAMPFTGIGVEPLSEKFAITITCRTPFDRMTFFYKGAGSISVTSVTSEDEPQIYGAAQTAEGVYEIAFRELLESVRLELNRSGDVTLAGVSLSSDITGSYLHSVGNNGATYSSYNSIPGFGREFAVLEPDLVMIALGTNEAFGTLDPETFTMNIDELVSTIRAHSPNTRIMLITPNECFKRIRGKRRRSINLTPNTRVETVRNLILKYGADNGIPVYDTHSILASASSLKQANLLSRDGVHFTAHGYRLLGNLLSDALLESLMVD